MYLLKLRANPLPPTEDVATPAKLLWARVLQRAIFDYVLLKNSPNNLKNKRELREVEQWIFGNSSLNNSIFQVCSVLGISVDKVRTLALSMTKEDIKKIEYRDTNKSVDIIGQ